MPPSAVEDALCPYSDPGPQVVHVATNLVGVFLTLALSLTRARSRALSLYLSLFRTLAHTLADSLAHSAQVVHVATNLMGVYVRPLLLKQGSNTLSTSKDEGEDASTSGGGFEVEIDFEYRQPREQYAPPPCGRHCSQPSEADFPRLEHQQFPWVFAAQSSLFPGTPHSPQPPFDRLRVPPAPGAVRPYPPG